MWKLNNTLLNNQWVKKEITTSGNWEIENTLRRMKIKVRHTEIHERQQKQYSERNLQV